MNLKDCEVLLAAAIEHKACKGNADAARRYLDAGDVEGFERVCRGNYWWLKYRKIAYILTDGVAETRYANGQMSEQFNYFNGTLHGERTQWYPDGQVCEQANYANGRLHGKYAHWDSDGQVLEQSNYINGVKQP
jgi:antitoxin component YwqK of YwqJK toxin-antitoxin module